jgi:hypothetical protein
MGINKKEKKQKRKQQFNVACSQTRLKDFLHSGKWFKGVIECRKFYISNNYKLLPK